MIILKHLAREFDLDPYKMRQALRKEFPVEKAAGSYRKWKWEDPNDPELLKIKAFLKQLKAKEKSRAA